MRKTAPFPLKQQLLLACVSPPLTPTTASCSPQRAPVELDALPPPKRTLIFGVRIWRGLFLRDRVGSRTRTAGGTSGMRKGHIQCETRGCAELEDGLSRGCSGPTMCNTSPSAAPVFLAWFPEEMRPPAAASPPLPGTARRKRGARQPSGRHSSLREGERPVTARPPQPGAEHVLPKPGAVWERGRRSSARGTPFCTTSSVLVLEPRYPNSCGMK